MRHDALKLLQRHILWELVRVFAMLLAGLTVMLVFVGLLHEGTERGLAPRFLLQIMPFVVPSLLPFTIPATLLLAVTVVYGRMAGELEVTAAKSAGVHPVRLLTPAFLLGGILTVASFALTDRAIPWAVTNIETVVTQATEDIFMDVLKTQHHFSSPTDGYSILVDDVRDKTLIMPSFTYRLPNHQQISVKADWARVQFNVKDRKAKLYFKNAAVSVPGEDSSGRMKEWEWEFDLKDDLRGKKPRHLTIEEIQEKVVTFSAAESISRIQHDQEIAMLLLMGEFDLLSSKQTDQFDSDRSWAVARKYRMETEIHTRYAMAGSCLFFAFLGGPFAVLQARRQFITSFIMCFLPILLIYYPVTFLMVNLSKTGSVGAWWSMWVPNVIIGVAAILVMRRVIRH
ncbi:MAG: LptF/LptG family permease [Fuerstiella sp.]|nr:LptF/LptG family permease [Fuerstiella sp.]